MKNLSVREAKKSDIPFLLSLIKELAQFEKLYQEVKATEVELSKYLFEKEPKAFVLIAENNDQAIGFALYFYNFSTFLAKPGIYLEDLYVKEDFRSLGAGALLLKTLAQIASANQCGRLEWSVLDWNQKAIDFYLKLGAVPMNDWTLYRMNQRAIAKLAET